MRGIQRVSSLAAAVAITLMPTLLFAQRPRRGEEGPPRDPLRFEFVGSASGGRVASVAGVPGSSQVYYAGAASGGVWKTTDGGRTFLPIFDSEPVQAIGALAVAPSDSSIVSRFQTVGVSAS